MDTKQVQTILKQLGLTVGEVDGIAGTKTINSIKEFQDIFSLSVDGIVGTNTGRVLQKLSNVVNFKVDEFRCRHCKRVKLESDLLILLEKIRASTGVIKITSGYRCTTHNKNVGGARNSKHLLGLASDIQVVGVSPSEVYQVSDKINATGGVGKYNTFTHIDTRHGKARW